MFSPFVRSAALLAALLWAPSICAQALSVSPTELEFETVVGQASPPNQIIRITPAVAGQVFAARVEVQIISTDWLSLLPTNGQGPADVTASVDTSRFTSPGTREANIIVTVPETEETAVVRVMVNVQPATTQPRFSAAPSSMLFASSGPGVEPPAQALTITNPGGGALNYTAAVNYPIEGPQDWLDISPTSGTVTLDSQVHQVSVLTAGLPAQATLSAELVFESLNASNEPFVVPVVLTIGAAPILSASPDSFFFFSTEGASEQPAAQAVELINTGGGLLAYQITAGEPWLSIDPMAGDASETPTSHQISVDASALAPATYVASLEVTSETLGAPVAIPVTLVVSPPSSIFAAPSSMDFFGNSGIPIRESRVISVVNTPLSPGEWSARVVPQGTGWLRLSSAGGEVPGQIIVEVDSGSLGEAQLAAEIEIISGDFSAAPGPAQSTPPVSIPVSLTIVNNPPALSIAPSTLLLQGVAGRSEVLTRLLRVDNTGGPQLNWTATIDVDGVAENESGWLSVSPDAGTAPTVAGVAADTAGLPAGVYHGRVRIAAGGSARTLPVVLVLSEQDPVLDPSLGAAYWQAVEGDPALADVDVRVVNRGVGDAGWSTQTGLFIGPTSWLRVSPPSGVSSDDPQLGFSEFALSADVDNLAPGLYGALTQISAAGASSPRWVASTLRVIAQGESVPATMAPGGMVFEALGTAPGAGLDSQQVAVWRNREGVQSFQTGATVASGTDWLQVAPRQGQTSAAGRADFEVSVDPDGLAPGVYRGLAGITFGDGLVQSAAVTLIVPANGAGFCESSGLALTPLSPATGFSGRAGRAVPLQVELRDDCGEAVEDAAVFAELGAGEGALALEPIGGGRYAAVWAPLAGGSQRNIAFTAAIGSLRDSARVIGSIAGAGGSVVARGGTVNSGGFRPGEAISPGEIVSVFGSGFIAGEQAADSIPLPNQLDRIALRIGSRQAPLYFASLGQINAQAPYELEPNTIVQVIAVTETGYSVPARVGVTTARPGLFSNPSAGTQRAIVQNQDGSLNSPANPALRGEAVVVYVSGIGDVLPLIASGAGSPEAEPFARGTLAASATIGESEAEIFFLGMTPGFVGLAQANLIVPADARVGDDVALTLTIDGNPSNTLVVSIGAAP